MGYSYEKTVKIALELLKDSDEDVKREVVVEAVGAALICVATFTGSDYIALQTDEIIMEVQRLLEKEGN